jgi:cytoskeletal protein CcmA (bactofilin family)
MFGGGQRKSARASLPATRSGSGGAAAPSRVTSSSGGLSCKEIDEERRSGAFVLVGKGTTLQGEVKDCSLFEVHGTFEGEVSADAVVVCEGGMLHGGCDTEHAEIHGTVEGRLTVRDLLDVRGRGSVSGEVAYGSLSVTAGGHVSGELLQQAPEVIDATAHETADEPNPWRVNGEASWA